jgi:hypothetical protein
MNFIDSLLAQFPGPVRLPASRRCWVSGLLTCAVLMACAVIKVGSDHAVIGWAGFMFFGFCAAGCIAVMVFGLSELVLDQHGFMTRLGRTRNYWKWTDVSDFAVVPDELVPFLKRVGFNYRKAEWGPLLKMLDRSNQPFEWRTRCLFDTYRLSKDDCARLLSQWQQRALSDNPR